MNRTLHFGIPLHLGLVVFLLVQSAQMGMAQHFELVTRGDQLKDTTNTNGASFVDYDDDGDLDIFLTNAQTPFGFNSLYRNEVNALFVNEWAGELTGMQVPSFGNAWGDVDNDGLADVFVVNGFTQGGSMLYKNLGHGNFSRLESYNPHRSDVRGFGAAFGDYDNDGKLDFVVTHPAGFVGTPATGSFLFHNEGEGKFSEVTDVPFAQVIAPYTNATWADYDQDGDIDLFIGSGPANGSTGRDFLYHNQFKETGKARFVRITQAGFARDLQDGQVWNWIDYDNDGDLDAFVTNWGGNSGGMQNNLYVNRNGNYVKEMKGEIVLDNDVSLANVWGDFDNDGDLDCYVGNGNNMANRYYKNMGDGTFRAIREGHFVEEKRNTWGVSMGDYDNDGDLDLFVSNKTNYTSGKGDINFLYRNDIGNSNHWLMVQCVGMRSNKMGFGTKIKVTAKINGNEVTQYREVGSISTFLGSNDLRAHFGLGNAGIVRKLEIIWPSGQTDTYYDVMPDRTIIATEGRGIN